MQNLGAVEGRIHVPEFHLALHGGMLLRRGPVLNGRTAAIQLHHLVGRGLETLEIVDEIAKLAHGVGQRPRQLGKDRQLAGGQLPLDDQITAQKYRDDGHGMGQNLNKREEAEPFFVDVQLAVPESGAALLELFFLKALPGKGLYHPIARDVFLRARVHFAELFPHEHKQGPGLPGVQIGDEQQQRRDHHQKEGQPPAGEEKADQRTQKDAHAVHDSVAHVGHEMAAPVQVAGHAGHQLAGTVAVEVPGVLILQPFEQPAAQLEHIFLRSFFQHDDHGVAHALPAQLHRQHHRQKAQQGFGILRHDYIVHQFGAQGRIDQQKDAGNG